MKPILATLLLLATAAVAHATLIVDTVHPGSPAAAAGMQEGDQIIQLDGREIATMDDLGKVTAARKPGDTVPLIVERDGRDVELKLEFGARPGGGVSIGISIAVDPDIDDSEPLTSEDVGSVECLGWIEETYRIESMMKNLGLDLSDVYETIRACVVHDTRRMSAAKAIQYCDNVFKIHCSGVDLLAEIGEAQVERCEELLSESLGLKPKQYKGWKSCADDRVFDLYSMAGESSDEEACRAAFLDGCGTNIETAIKTGTLSPEQRGFVECCSVDVLSPEGRGRSDCPMIDDGFERGPCHDRPVCVNRLTTEWIDCSVLE